MKNHSVRITFIGDLMCQKEQTQAVHQRHGAYKYHDTFSAVRPLFEGSDLVIGNLETPLAGKTSGYSTETFRFNTPDAFVEAARDVGIGFVSIANNHILDRGITGLDRTIQILRDHDIGHTGGYSKPEDADTIEIREINGLKIAILAFTYGTNSEYYGEPLPENETWRVDLLRAQSPVPSHHTAGSAPKRPLKCHLPLRVRMALSALAGNKARRVPDYTADNVAPEQTEREIDLPFLARTKEKILRARYLADIVIVLPHMGGQYNPSPGEYSKWTMRWIAELGVDVIIANHPHVPLRCEQFENGTIGAFSLGNFCFNPSDGCFVPGQMADLGIVLHLEISAATRKISAASIQVVKTEVETDGFAVVHPATDLIKKETDPMRRQKLTIENEVVVNRFRGSSGTVVPQDEYPCSLRP